MDEVNTAIVEEVLASIPIEDILENLYDTLFAEIKQAMRLADEYREEFGNERPLSEVEKADIEEEVYAMVCEMIFKGEYEASGCVNE